MKTQLHAYTSKEFTIYTGPQKNRISDYIGQLADNYDETQVSTFVDRQLSIYEKKVVRFIHFETVTDEPKPLYKILTSELRHALKSRWNIEPLGGFRLFNIVPFRDRWRVVFDVVIVDGPSFALKFYEVLQSVLRHPTHRTRIYVHLKAPRGNRDRNNEYINRYREYAFMPTEFVPIRVLEPYYWVVEAARACTLTVMQGLLECLPEYIRKIENGRGLSFCLESHIDTEDYAVHYRSMPRANYRTIQTFGKSFNPKQYQQ